MVVLMFLKNGKTWIIPNDATPENSICCDSFMHMRYKGEDVTASMTEQPEDLLPTSFKKSNPENFVVFECRECGKFYIRWVNGNWKSMEYFEVKLLPDSMMDLKRENERYNEVSEFQ